MKKSHLFLFLFVIYMTGCSEDNAIEEISSGNDEVSTRTIGDTVYDALGYGYDITEEYLGENSTMLQVIDVASFIQANRFRFDNPFMGVIDQRCYAGEDATTFLKEVVEKSNFSGSVASMKKNDEKGFFSATVTKGFESDTKYLYSSKYSFARAEVLKKQRRYLLNADAVSLARYLTPPFLSDLGKLSADAIVRKYGTHVLTNIVVGGRYTALYKSAIVEQTNHSEKKNIVSAGAKYNMSRVGLDLAGSWDKKEITDTNTKNSNWRCKIRALGGSTSGTTMTLSPTQGPTYTVNLGAWTESVDDKHSILVDVDWDATYPIYEFILNPSKRAQVKAAVERYIMGAKIDVMQLLPLYAYVCNTRPDKGMNHDVTTYPNLVEEYPGWVFSRLEGYILKDPLPGTIPLYEYFNANNFDHYTTTIPDLHSTASDFVLNSFLGYVYESFIPGTTILYEYFTEGASNHYTSTYPNVVQEFPGWVKFARTSGYIYSAGWQ